MEMALYEPLALYCGVLFAHVVFDPIIPISIIVTVFRTSRDPVACFKVINSCSSATAAGCTLVPVKTPPSIF